MSHLMKIKFGHVSLNAASLPKLTIDQIYRLRGEAGYFYEGKAEDLNGHEVDIGEEPLMYTLSLMIGETEVLLDRGWADPRPKVLKTPKEFFEAFKGVTDNDIGQDKR